MTAFPEQANDDYSLVNLEDTDRTLPDKINQSTRYAYFKTIAKGGKSVVQSCKDLHLGRVICYKKLRPEFLQDPIEQVRFLREARVTAMLQHPNIVPTYEVGRDGQGNIFFTMKLVHGYTLREIIDYRERYDLTQLIDIIIQVAHALEYAHAHRVVHRDIKPENILVGRYGEVLLLDWGLAKVWRKDGTSSDYIEPKPEQNSLSDAAKHSSMTGYGKLQGTLAYMSPEQIQRDPSIDYRTDIYSLGAVLYETISGIALVEGDTVDSLTQQILAGAAQVLSKVSKMRVPRLLDEVTVRCLQFKPDDRFLNCGDLVRMLREDWN